MHILIAPDKFKEALSATEAAQAMAAGVRKALPQAGITLLPMADGGEGTAALLTRINKGITCQLQVKGPSGQPLRASWGYASSRQQAYIELAEASGLQRLPPYQRNPLYTTTYGTGQLIAAALQKGATSIILGLGGSATNEGGCGMAAALGVRFLDKRGKPLPFLSAQNLLQICHISAENLHPALHKCRIVAACDVNNPLTGAEGASYTFAPQKGAAPEELPQLEEGLQHLAALIKEQLGKDVAGFPGSGAAGGAGAGVVAFLNGSLQNGSELLLQQSGFEEKLEQADLLLTGEGCFDNSSLQGKLIGQLCEMADRKNKQVVVFCGKAGSLPQKNSPASLQAVYPISEKETDLQTALQHATGNLENAVYEYLKKTYAP